MSDRHWYEDYQEELAAEQKGMEPETVTQLLENKRDEDGRLMYSSVFDPNNAPKVAHIWVDRGAKFSCEGAGHPNHQSWKRRT